MASRKKNKGGQFGTRLTKKQVTELGQRRKIGRVRPAISVPNSDTEIGPLIYTVVFITPR